MGFAARLPQCGVTGAESGLAQFVFCVTIKLWGLTMYKLSTAIVAASLAFSGLAQAGSDDRVNRVLSLLGERGVEDVTVQKRGNRTVMRGVQNGRVVEVVVRRENDDDDKNDDHDDDRPREAAKPVKKAKPAPTGTRATAEPKEEKKAEAKDEKKAEPKQLKKAEPKEEKKPAKTTKKVKKKKEPKGDGLRGVNKADRDAVYDGGSKGSAAKDDRPSVNLGGIRDMAKGPRSKPAASPAR